MLLDTTIVAIIAAIPPTLLALGTLLVSIRTRSQTTAIAKQNESLVEKTAEIHTATNGTLHTVTKELEVANAEIQGMKKLIAEMVAGKKELKEVRKRKIR